MVRRGEHYLLCFYGKERGERDSDHNMWCIGGGIGNPTSLCIGGGTATTTCFV